MNKFIDMIVSFITLERVYVPILSILIGVIIFNIIKAALKRMLKGGKTPFETKKRLTVLNLTTNIVKYFLIVIIFIIILDSYGVDTASIIAGLGIFSAVLGLALQDTVKDFVGGITIILENYYVVGDYVKYKDFLGQVTEFGLKSTKIKNYHGEVMILANRNVTEIINLSQSKQNVTLELNVAYEEDLDKVEETINKILPLFEEIEYVQKGSCKYLGVDKLSDNNVVYLIILSCVQDKQWQVKRDALGIVKKEFDKLGIKIPYPQIEVHNAK